MSSCSIFLILKTAFKKTPKDYLINLPVLSPCCPVLLCVYLTQQWLFPKLRLARKRYRHKDASVSRRKTTSVRHNMLLCRIHDVSLTHLSDNAFIKIEWHQLKLDVAQGKEDKDVMCRDLGENTHDWSFVGWCSTRVLGSYWKDASPESLHQLSKWRANCMPSKMSECVCVCVCVDAWKRKGEQLNERHLVCIAVLSLSAHRVVTHLHVVQINRGSQTTLSMSFYWLFLGYIRAGSRAKYSL